MAPALTKVIYQPKQKSATYHLIVNPEEYATWKESRSTPIVQVVDSTEIFASEHGAQGQLRRPSKQQLETDFDEKLASVEGEQSINDKIIEIILEHGKAEQGDGIRGHWGSTNDARGNLGVSGR